MTIVDDKEEQIPPEVRIVVRPIGSALPLGFFAFAVGSVLIGALDLKWIPKEDIRTLVFMLLGYVAPLEILASILAYFARDTGTGTTMAVFGGSWVVIALQLLVYGNEPSSTTMGIFMATAAVVILAIASTTVSTKPLMSVFLLLAALRYVLSAYVQFGGERVADVAVGTIGLLVGALAVYGGLALLVEDVRQRTILPVFRRGSARQSLEGALGEQLERVRHEAGVRQQL